MITVNIYGLDQFLVGDLSRPLCKSLAKLYEVEEDDINFIASNNMVFHSGAEQTSWRVIVEVNAPKKLEVLQDQVIELLKYHISQIAIHIEIYFRYYSSDHHYLHINKDYPLYMSDTSSLEVEAEGDYPDDIEEGEGDDEIYTGDIFEGLKH